jgi:hypothetical protein
VGWNHDFDDADVKALAESPYLNRLVSLGLILAWPRDEHKLAGLKALFHSPNLKNLLVLATSAKMTAVQSVNDSFFRSPLPQQLLRLHLFPSDEGDVPGRYLEVLGDRLIISSEI